MIWSNIETKKQVAFFFIGGEIVDVSELTYDTVITIQIYQDPHVDQFERNVVIFFGDDWGRFGGLFEILQTLTICWLCEIAQKFFILSIMKNLYYVECDLQNSDNCGISWVSKNFNCDKLEIADENKAEMINDDHFNIRKENQTEHKIKNRWYRRGTDLKHREDINFDQSEPESN